MRSLTDHVVMWDGTSARPWGKMLFAPRSVQRDAPKRSEHHGEITALIRQKRSVMGHDWLTVAEIAAIIDRSVSETMSPVCALANAGQLEREHAPLGGRMIGGVVQRYRWR